jgi:hypothetical protein
MTVRCQLTPFFVYCAVLFLPTSNGAELLTINQENWNDTVPQGKEVDCILGDYCLRNDQIVVIIGNTDPQRHANMTTKNVGGVIIDLTFRNQSNDQLTAYYPLPPNRPLQRVPSNAQLLDSQKRTSSLTFRTEKVANQPDIEVVYQLSDGQAAVLITTTYTNNSDKELTADVQDHVRADGDSTTGVDASLNLFWAQDVYWKQAYGVVLTDKEWRYSQDKRILRYLPADQPNTKTLKLAPGKSLMVQRWLFPATDTLAVRSAAARLNGQNWLPFRLSINDAKGSIQECTIELRNAQGQSLGFARTSQLSCELPSGEYQARISAQGRELLSRDIDLSTDTQLAIELPLPGLIQARITDGEGRSIACKCEFKGRDGTPDPNFGPRSADRGVGNLQYTPDGKFECEILPGSYDLFVSHGFEYDLVQQSIKVEAGKTTEFQVKLNRSVDTSGWISADFHSHSSPSGDNTASQLGRVLNLLCEHIEFAPCTEHNRIDTYDAHLQTLNAVDRLATCSGMELTGSLLPVNHQNAFPLKLYPRTQNNGGPIIDADPVVQIERLAMWDSGNDKLMQMNHPNLVQVLCDKDLDGKPDGGFAKMLSSVDVIEVHPPEIIFEKPSELPLREKDRGNPIFHWMQMLNLGYRIPAVVNTDSHWNFHGSGWLRNYIRSTSDDPSQVQTMDMVHACERGALMITNGPYLEVKGSCQTAQGNETAELGDTLHPQDGKVLLHVRVQCANWVRVNRVQVFVNGHPLPEYNYTTGSHRSWFTDGPIVFDQTLQISTSGDAHLVVAVIGEGEKLGVVVGPENANKPPTAVTNPIFVDTDSNGFQPSRDQLGLDLPLLK